MACTHYQNPLCYKQLLLCTVNETIVLTAHFDVTSNLYLFFSLTGSDGQLCYRVLKSLFKSESCLFLTSPEISRKIWPWLNEWKPWNKSLRLKSWSAACNSLSDHDQFHCAICIPSSKKLFSGVQSPFCKVAASSDYLTMGERYLWGRYTLNVDAPYSSDFVLLSRKRCLHKLAMLWF